MNDDCVAAALTPEEIDVVESYMVEDNDGCFIETSAYAKLLDYFADEMPYGTAKARTGEPDIWILERLSEVTTP